jgi:hypothetical protein
VPSLDDLVKVKKMCELLWVFDRITKII